MQFLREKKKKTQDFYSGTTSYLSNYNSMNHLNM